MREFMLLIRNDGSTKGPREGEFLRACKAYIETLKGKIISAQPLIREGRIVSGTPGAWKEVPFAVEGSVLVGYYHILAGNLEEAVAIAKKNPEFAFTTSASVEVRPIKTAEASTEFVYPSAGLST